MAKGLWCNLPHKQQHKRKLPDAHTQGWRNTQVMYGLLLDVARGNMSFRLSARSDLSRFKCVYVRVCVSMCVDKREATQYKTEYRNPLKPFCKIVYWHLLHGCKVLQLSIRGSTIVIYFPEVTMCMWERQSECQSCILGRNKDKKRIKNTTHRQSCWPSEKKSSSRSRISFH